LKEIMTKPTLSSQLAVDYEPGKARFPLMAFHKVDGVRGNHFTGGLTGRSLKAFKNKAVTAAYASDVYAGMDGEFTIDGRLTGHDLCSLTTGLMGRIAGEANVAWNLFDWLAPHVVDMHYFKRYTALYAYLEASKPAGVHLLPFEWVHNVEEAQAFIDKSLTLGYEGAIFRDPKEMHKSGRATAKLNSFWRFKPASDKDAIVIEVYEADENQNEAKKNELGQTERSTHKGNKVAKGMAGGFICTDVESGDRIRVPAGTLKHDERIEAWVNRSAYPGRALKYRSLDTGVKDAPRQARFVGWRIEEDMS
jgi:DNA ligase-1